MLTYLKASTPGKWVQAKNDLERSGDGKRAILREWLKVTKNELNPPLNAAVLTIHK